MRKIQITNQTPDGAFVLMLFSFFAVAVLAVLMAGAQSYKAVTDRMESQYTERTCLAYVEAKLHHYDMYNAIAVETFGDGTAIALRETVDGTDYKTLIYYYDGYIRELYCAEDLTFTPADGEKVTEAAGLQIQWMEKNLLKITCRNVNGRSEELMYYLRAA